MVQSESSGAIVFSLLLASIFAGMYYVSMWWRNKKPQQLDPIEYRPFKLIEKKVVSHNTRLFRIALSNSTDTLGLPLGRHISVKALINGQEVVRSYTPISTKDTQGHFNLLIKIYPAPFGSMSSGDKILVRGPKGKFSYQPNMRSCFGMIAGGTGITPMYQLIQAILNDPEERTELCLIFANVTVDDILLKNELEALAKQNPRFTVYFVLNQPPDGWKQGVGFVNRQHIEEHIGFPQKGRKMVLHCGPPPMNKAVRSLLLEIGYDEEDLFKF
eukprot:jgi/Galph1/4790/GphlegSOOS_G3473.1